MKRDRRPADDARDLQNIEVARAAVLRQTKGQQITSGLILCPICEKANLRYFLLHNGTMHGHCNSDKCVSWME